MTGTRGVRRWLQHEAQLHTPHYGQTALLVVLAAAGYSIYLAGFEYATAIHAPDGLLIYPWFVPVDLPERHSFVTLLSFLPFDVLHQPALFWSCVAGFVVCAGLWAMRRFCRWIGVLTAFFYTAALSLFWEHAAAIAEWWNSVAVTLMIFGAWYYFHGREIEAASRAGDFWQRALFPQWVHDLCIFNLAWFFFLAGAMKLAVSGFDWVDGTVLQLNIHRWRIDIGQENQFIQDLVLGNRDLATLASTAALICENASILAVLSIVFPRLWPIRALVGATMAGFLLGVFVLLGRWNFESLFVLVLVIMLPFDRWIPRGVEWWRARPPER